MGKKVLCIFESFMHFLKVLYIFESVMHF